MKFMYTLQKIILTNLIIIDDNIVNKKFSNFKELIKNYVVAYNWINKYKNYYVLNRHIIISHKRILHLKQYFINQIVNWFNIFSGEFCKEWKFFKIIFLNVEMISIDVNMFLSSFNNYNNLTNITILMTSMLNSFQFMKTFKN